MAKARLEQFYRDKIVPELKQSLGLSQRHAGAEDLQDHGQHGRGRGGRGQEDHGQRGRRSDEDHRAEAAGHARAQVGRDVQGARRPRDRREGHAARRAHVRVPGPAGEHRDAAHPRLPRRERAFLRRPGQLQLRRQGTDHFPRDRLRPDRCDPRHGHHDHDDGDATTNPVVRCSKRSIFRSASNAAQGEVMAKTSMVNREDEARQAGEALCGEARAAEGNHPQADVERGRARSRGRCSCSRCRATRARAASATAAQSPVVRAVSTASSALAAPSCAKRPCAAKFRASERPAGNSWNHWSTT